MTSASLSYRADIQGLRALAIILVVFCHAGMPGFAGGFIGVDIFFVLSGYLITGLLLRESENTDRINFLLFYARRFKRLLPALIVVTLATLGFAYFILAPFEQISQAAAAYSVPVWVSNFYFSFSDFDYFGQEASSNLFLHTWSLAVEEQFYLVWPLLIFILVFKVQHTDPDKNNPANNLLFGLAWILLISLIMNVYWAQTSPVIAFYLMPSRAWQFALGGIMFVLGDRFLHLLTNASMQKVMQCSGVAGLILIVIPLTYLDDSSVYPGFNAVLPSLGAALIIFNGLNPREQLLTKVLSLRWMQKIGDLSYSWYLWHWPILGLGSLLFPQGSLTLRLAIIALSYILAYLTFILVESPIRHFRVLGARPLLTVSSSLAVMLLALAIVNQWDNRAERNARTPEQLPYLTVRNDMPVIYRNGCDDWYTSARVVACSFGNNEAENTAILVGDSIGAQWFSALAENFTVPGWRFVVFTKSSCPIVDVPIFYARIGAVYEVCSQWRDEVLVTIAELKPQYVFIGNASSYSYSAEEWQSGTESILRQLTTASSEVFIIPGTLQLPFDVPGCLARNEWQPEFLANLNSCAYSETESSDPVFAALSKAAEAFPNTHILDLGSLVCPQNNCAAYSNETIVFRDNQHLTNTFVANKSADVLQRIVNLTELSFAEPFNNSPIPE